MKNSDGNAYILVLITMMTVLIILSTLMYMTKYEVNITQTYKETGNLYDLAVAGVKQAAFIMNNELKAQRNAIVQQSVQELHNEGIDGVAEYDPDTKQFYLKSGIYTSKIAESADRFILEAFKARMSEKTGKYSFSYTIDTADGKEEKFMVAVEITPDISEKPYTYGIQAVASKDGIDTMVKVSAKISLKFEELESIIEPEFMWRNIPDWGYCERTDYYSLGFLGALPELSINEPILIIENPGEVTIDTGSFYNGGMPVPTIILNLNPDTVLCLSGANTEYNGFSGLIFSAGTVNLDHVYFTGSVVSGKDIISDTSFLVPDHDMLFKINIKNMELRNKITDFLNITDFKGAGTGKREEAVRVLKNLGLSPSSSFKFMAEKEPVFTVGSIKQIY